MHRYVCTDIPWLWCSRKSELRNRYCFRCWNCHCLWSLCRSYGLHYRWYLWLPHQSCHHAGLPRYRPHQRSGLGANGIGAGCNGCWCIALTAEIILTALFVLVVLGATHKTNGATGNFAGLAIGLSLILIHLVGIYFTGTSVNPARSIGPAIFACGEALTNLWIFIVGPFVGALIAAVLWKVVEPKEK